MEIYITQAIETLIFPPGLNILLIIAGLLLLQRRPWLGKTLLWGAAALLYLFSLPTVSHWLAQSIEHFPALTSRQIEDSPAQAIVIIGAGRYDQAPEYDGEDTVSVRELERLRYGAYLRRRTGLPILLSGGSPLGERQPEAELMADVLEADFHVKARWLEVSSKTTHENAQFSAQVLQGEGIEHILLVAHAMHMPRAVHSFVAAGLQVTPAPVGYHTPDRGWSMLPNADALRSSQRTLHEILGMLWYRLRH